jgi:hypothetical protein
MIRINALLRGPTTADALNSEPPVLLLKPEQAAKALNIGVRQLRYMKARREIPYVPIGSSVRYDIADIRDLIELKKVPAIAC